MGKDGRWRLLHGARGWERFGEDGCDDISLDRPGLIEDGTKRKEEAKGCRNHGAFRFHIDNRIGDIVVVVVVEYLVRNAFIFRLKLKEMHFFPVIGLSLLLSRQRH